MLKGPESNCFPVGRKQSNPANKGSFHGGLKNELNWSRASRGRVTTLNHHAHLADLDIIVKQDQKILGLHSQEEGCVMGLQHEEGEECWGVQL